MTQDDHAPASPLDYAGRLPPNTRTSKVAVASLVAAILCSPWLLSPLYNWFNWYLPQSSRQTGGQGYLHRWAVLGAMGIATTLALIALIRIRVSRGKLLGAGTAWVALLLSLLWWCVPIGFLLLFWLSGDKWLQ